MWCGVCGVCVLYVRMSERVREKERVCVIENVVRFWLTGRCGKLVGWVMGMSRAEDDLLKIKNKR